MAARARELRARVLCGYCLCQWLLAIDDWLLAMAIGHWLCVLAIGYLPYSMVIGY